MPPKEPAGPKRPGKDPVNSVLIVDDDKDIAVIIKEIVEAEGYRAIAVSNGQEALAVLDQERPALMLVDLFMPVMGGIEMLKIIKRNPRLADIPRVIMTGANDSMLSVKEDVPVLYKPVDFDALTGLLQKYCDPVSSASKP